MRRRRKPIRTLFFGTSAFAVPSLHAMAERTQLDAVVTQPDRPSGRGQKLQPTPVKTAAMELGIRTIEPVSMGALASDLTGTSYDLFTLASYGRILPQALLDIPKLGALNVHPSLLPKYRGATPVQAALLNGDTETGVTIMLMDAGMDTGGIVLQERMPIDPDERYGELHDRLAAFGANVLKHALDIARAGNVPAAPQQGEPVLTRPITKADLEIDWRWSAKRIVDTVRAYGPVPGARAQLCGEQMKILRAGSSSRSVFAGEPGTVAGAFDGALSVRCGDGAVDVLEVVPPNRKLMKAAALLQ